MKYIYGPVNSRRLGLSLGISLIPYKTCSFDCVYCQLGRTTAKVSEKKEYAKLKDVLAELKFWLSENPRRIKDLKYITFAGAGEPTLNIKIGKVISAAKKITHLPVAVITNSFSLGDARVQGSLMQADLIVPSLDAVNQRIFQKLNRPYRGIKIKDIIEGLINLRKGFSGEIWLEIMLVKGINDDLGQIAKMKLAIARINPDRIQLNSPVRMTAEPNIFAVDKDKLEKIKKILGDKCEII